MGNITNTSIIGTKFNMLTATEIIKKNNRTYCKCTCDCGNETMVLPKELKNGHKKSCGCLKKQNHTDLSIIGQKFNKLTVISYSHYDKPNHYFNCKCDCGKSIVVRRHDLVSNNTKSCGCLKKPDIIGERYGKLTVIEDLGVKNGRQIFKCLCDCGNVTEVTRSNLHTTNSCGCLNSLGESKIIDILISNNITFITQKTFPDLKLTKLLRFDFYILDKKYLIEFDGKQHFEPVKAWGGEERYNIQKEIDRKKNEYCKINNIPLIRIPYDRLNNLTINDLLLETTNYLV